MFEIGEKIKWEYGNEKRPITVSGLYYEDLDGEYSEVIVLAISGVPTKKKMTVLTSMLSKDV